MSGDVLCDAIEDIVLGVAADGVGIDDLRFVRASSVTIVRPRYAWQDRIPLGGYTNLAGREGKGKTLFAMHLGARITRGQLAGDLFGQPSEMLYVGHEDAKEWVLVPRLMAAGADLERVYFLETSSGATFTVSAYLDDLDVMLSEHAGIRYIVVDPIDSHLGERVDAHRKAEVQGALGRLAQLAQRHDCAIVGIAHLNKGADRDLLARMVGSVGFSTSARATLGVGEHPDDPADRVVVLAKANYVDKTEIPAIRFRAESATVEGSGESVDTASVVWLGEEHGIDPDSIVSGLDATERTERDEAADWLRDVLKDGAVAYRDIERSAQEDGISRATLHRAQKLIGVTVKRDTTRRGRPSTWSLDVSSHAVSYQSHRDPRETKSAGGPTSANNEPESVSSHVSGTQTKTRNGVDVDAYEADYPELFNGNGEHEQSEGSASHDPAPFAPLALPSDDHEHARWRAAEASD